MTDVPGDGRGGGLEPASPASMRDIVYALVFVIVVIGLLFAVLIWLLTGFDGFCCGTRPPSSPR